MPDSHEALYGSDYSEDDRYLGKLRDLPVKLHWARVAFQAQFRETLKAHDLSDQQFRVLRILSQRDMLETGQIATLAMLLGPSLSRILKDLAIRGLITRHNTSADGRVSYARLTPEARNMIEALVPEFNPLYEALADRLSVDEVNDLNRLLDKLTGALETINFRPKGRV
ncbi:MAG TPA: MarR family transcriptional regulator [Rhizobium sp.]